MHFVLQQCPQAAALFFLPLHQQIFVCSFLLFFRSFYQHIVTMYVLNLVLFSFYCYVRSSIDIFC